MVNKDYQKKSEKSKNR